MSCYGNEGGGLYDIPGTTRTQTQETADGAGGAAAAEPSSSSASSSDGVGQALELIAAPVTLLESAVEPASTKLPYGLAVLGACVFAPIW